MPRLLPSAAALLLSSLTLPALSAPVTAEGPAWKTARTVDLHGLTVSLSEPVLVARSKGYLWFPTLARFADGDLLALMSDYPDEHVATATSRVCWSRTNSVWVVRLTVKKGPK